MTNNESVNTDGPDDLDSRRSAALARLEAAHDADPRTHFHGFFSRDDLSGGVGMFHWYASREARLESIAVDLPLLVDKDDPELTKAIRAAAHEPNHLADGALLEALQEQLEGLQELVWIGTFDELCASTSDWPGEVRSEFHGDEDGPRSPDRTIRVEERDAFVAFLREFGF